MGDMVKRGSVAWMLEQAFNEDDFSSERIAWILASLSVGDVRNMFWSVEEFGQAFQLKAQTVRRWAREREVQAIQFSKGGQWFFSKAGVLRALQEQIAMDVGEFPVVMFGASAVNAAVKGIRSGKLQSD